MMVRKENIIEIEEGSESISKKHNYFAVSPENAPLLEKTSSHPILINNTDITQLLPEYSQHTSQCWYYMRSLFLSLQYHASNHSFHLITFLLLVLYVLNDVSSTLLYKRELNALLQFPYIAAQANYFITFCMFQVGHIAVHLYRRRGSGSSIRDGERNDEQYTSMGDNITPIVSSEEVILTTANNNNDGQEQVVASTEAMPQVMNYVGVAICNTMSTTLNIIGANGMGTRSGSLMVILSQTTIPLSVLLSWLLLKKRYSKPQFLSLLFIFSGVIIVLVPSIIKSIKQRNVPHETVPFIYIVIYLSSVVPTVCEKMYQEYLLRTFPKLSVFTLGTYCRVYELFLNFLVLGPIYFLYSTEFSNSDPSNIFSMKYLDWMTNGLMVLYNNLTLVFIFNIVSFLWLLNGLVMMQYAKDVNLCFFGNAISFPFCALVFSIPFIKWLIPESMRSALSVYDFLSIIVLCVGLAIYCIGIHVQSKSATEYQRLQQRGVDGGDVVSFTSECETTTETDL